MSSATRLLKTTGLVIAMCAVLTLTATSAWGASVATDQNDYAPGDSVIITGTGFWAGETVTLQVVHLDGDPLGGAGHDPWNVTADAGGGFEAYWIVDYDDNVGEELLLTADGLTSGLHAETTFWDHNTILTITSAIPDSICPGDTLTVCAELVQNCGGSSTAPLAGREILFFINPGNCGANVGQTANDSALTNSSGDACAVLTFPTTPGNYTIRAKFRGEDKPNPCPNPGNSACNPTHSSSSKRCVELSSSNDCEPIVVDSSACDLCNGNTPSSFELVLTTDEDCLIGDSVSDPCFTPTGPDIDFKILGENTPWDDNNWLSWAASGVQGMNVIFSPTAATGATASVPISGVFGLNLLNDINLGVGVTNGVYDPPDDAWLFREMALSEPPANQSYQWFIVYDVSGSGFQNYVWYDGDGDANAFSGDFDYLIFIDDDHTGGNGDHDDMMVGVSNVISGDCTDPCDTNTAPVCVLPGDTTIFQCDPAQVCLPVGATDVDGNLDSCAILSGPGALSGANWCYTPVSEGTVTVIVECVDSCSATCVDSFKVTFEFNEPPACNLPSNQTFEQCDPTEVCLPVSATDADGNLVGCSIVSGPGALAGGNWCYTPTGDETVDVTIKCVDACGDSCFGNFSITFEINEGPTCELEGGGPPPPPQCTPPVHTILFSSTDPDGDTLTCGNTNPNATLGAGTWQYSPTPGEHVVDTITCCDPCGECCTLFVDIQFPNPAPPICEVPNDTTIFQCAPTQVCLPAFATGATCTIVGGGPGTLVGTNWCYTPAGDETVNVTIECAGVCDTCTASFEVTFMIGMPPSITCPGNETVQCIADIPACDPNDATVTGGTPPVVVTCSSTDNGGLGCPGDPLILTYTYIASDSCGDADTCSRTITVIDDTDPVITLCPPAITVQCDADVPAADTGLVSATDNCGNVTISHIGDSPLTGGACGGTITRTYRAEDDCGNTADCVQIITVDDTTPPTPVQCPAGLTVECESNIPAPDIGLVSATDNCGTVTISHVGDSPLTGGPCGGTITRTYRATDDCGNSTDCQQVITVNDTTPPVVTCPAYPTVLFQCASEVPDCDTASASATDNCDTAVAIRCERSDNGGDGCAASPLLITDRYIATDDCSNEDTCEVVFTVIDDTPPDITCPVYPTLNFQCADDVPDCDTSAASATDNCDNDVEKRCERSDNGGAGCAASPLVITDRYIATDDCGNEDTCLVVFTVIDDTPPDITCPVYPTLNFQCADDVPDCDTSAASATDNCDNDVEKRCERSDNGGAGCAASPLVITDRYIAGDDCGNEDTCLVVFTVIDDTPPVISDCPDDDTVDCAGDIPIPDPGLVAATDNCGGPVDIDFVSDQIINYGCQHRFTVLRTYEATDECGNAAQCEQYIIVRDNIPPVVTSFPNDTTVQCFDDVPLPNPSLITSTDNCGPSYAFHDSDTYTDSSACGATISRYYRIVDSCGNLANQWQTITVLDDTPPVITDCPDPATVECADAIPVANTSLVSATDNCDSVTITHDGDGPLTGGPCGGTVTRRYIAADLCGNADTCLQVFTVDDTTAPVITQCPANATVGCVDDIPAANTGLVIASDNCDDTVTITWVGDSPLPGGPCGGSVTRTYSATDDCGNVDYCQQIFTIDDNVPPVIVCPANLFLGCGDTIPVCDESDADVSDNCGGPVDVVCLRTDSSGSGQLGDPILIVDTYTATDECGNTSECERTIYYSCGETECNIRISVGPEAGQGKSGGVIQALNGTQVTVPIIIHELDVPIGGFDLLFCYDQTGLAAIAVSAGSELDEWEYFTYRLGSRSNCGLGCPTGLIRIIAIADLDNGPQHPSEPAFQPMGTIAELVFQVTEDRNFINQCLPIRFCWIDCGDNTVASRSGDTTFLETSILFDTCQSNPKGDPIPGLCVSDGFVCVREPIDDRGDLNLNAIANEVGDAVLYSRYFIYGVSVFHSDPELRAVQTLASDINDDGIVLTVADLVYLIRIITGDEQPFPPGGHPKMSPYVNDATVRYAVSDGVLSVSTATPVDLGAAAFVFRYSGVTLGEPELTGHYPGMSVRASANNGEMRVLIAPDPESPGSMASGPRELFRIPVDGQGTVELVGSQLSDAQGGLMSVSTAAVQRPEHFALNQNYPNPFNAGTVITFDLAEPSAWNLRIYNVAGQAVRTFSGSDDARNIQVNWDGTDNRHDPLASGIYFYRVSAGSFTATRKMTLLK
jgi:hypothetical protein